MLVLYGLWLFPFSEITQLEPEEIRMTHISLCFCHTKLNQAKAASALRSWSERTIQIQTYHHISPLVKMCSCLQQSLLCTPQH